MKILRNINAITAITGILLMIWSCAQDDPVTPDEDKYFLRDIERSVVPFRIKAESNEIYRYKIAVETNYGINDGFKIDAFFRSGQDSLHMDLYDDGVSDDSLRNDLAASNNIWSGGINANDFPYDGDWKINVNYLLSDSVVLATEECGTVYVVINSLPVIDSLSGINDSDVFESGFDTRNVEVTVSDSNNLTVPYDEQVLKLELLDNSGIVLKESSYSRINTTQDFLFNIDSTFAAAIPFSRNYRIKLTATDLYGDSSFRELTNITIRNTAPVLDAAGLVYPDTVFIPVQDSIYFSVTVKVNDPQGHLEYQDIDEVTVTINSVPFSMRDDGNENYYPYNSGDLIKNDGIYTATFKVKSTNIEAVYPFQVQACDKVGNLSNVLNGQIEFINGSKNHMEINGYENSNYIDIFK